MATPCRMGTNLGEAWELGPAWCETWDDLGFFKIEDPQYIRYDISKGANDDQSSDFGAAYSRVPKPILGYGFRHQPTAFHGTSEPWKPL